MMFLLPVPEHYALLYICQYHQDRKKLTVLEDEDSGETRVLVNRYAGVRVMSASKRHNLREESLEYLFNRGYITYYEKGANTVWLPTRLGLDYYFNYINWYGPLTIDRIAKQLESLRDGEFVEDEDVFESVFEEDESIFT